MTGLVVSILIGFTSAFILALIIYWMDRYEKEPKILLGAAFIWGAIVSAGGAFLINTVLGVGIYLFTGSEAAVNITTGSIFAPIIEESLKGFAVLLVFLVFRKEFDSVLDGIIYAAVTALGFAATENSYYIYTYGFLENGWSGVGILTFVRTVLVGWQHPFYTAFIGIGLAIARTNRSTAIKIVAPLSGWLVAILTHSAHNTLASFASGIEGLILGAFFDWMGWFFMAIFIIWMIARERKLLVKFLSGEVAGGTLTASQYKTACSAWAQTRARSSAFFQGRLRPTSRFYQLCGELAHKKHQLMTLGEEQGNQKTIELIRSELAVLSPSALF